MMDAINQKQIVLSHYCDKESYQAVTPLLQRLKIQGLRPQFVIIDGHRHIIRAFRETWPGVMIQRCLCHIQRESLRWLRSFPKTQAAKDLRFILLKLHNIKSLEARDAWLEFFNRWLIHHNAFLQALPNTPKTFFDLKRTVALIRNAIPDMFHYLSDSNIPATTNLLESFYSRLKQAFRNHRGLTELHKVSYLQWYCYFHNQNSNTLWPLCPKWQNIKKTRRLTGGLLI